MKCEEAVRDLPLLAYGELSFDEEESLEQHLGSCESCRREYERLQRIHEQVDRDEAQVPPGLVAECRRNLRLNIAAVAEQRRQHGFWQRLLPAVPFLKPAGAVALVATGFFGARLVEQHDTRILPGMEPSSTAAAALSPASRVRFVEPGGDGRVQIVVEETRQRVLSGFTKDEAIRRLLVSAAREASDPGLRVESVDLLGSAAENAEIRRVLLFALQHDPNPGVRLKALEGLRGAGADPETRKTLARVLLTDDNPGVRTQAIDLLIQKNEPEVVGVLQEALRRDSNNYVRLKCQKALHEMRASAESF
ncbi:MAG TPA: HEAT repeat domain-containing protein [Bryobacteraceae bacterium]|nr:HEAT repeat domain-containing protein [Bryobacteraceae bacterium]